MSKKHKDNSDSKKSWTIDKIQKLRDFAKSHTILCDHLGSPIDENTIFYIFNEDSVSFRLGQIKITDTVEPVSMPDYAHELCIIAEVHYLDGNDKDEIYLPLQDIKSIRKQKEKNLTEYITIENVLIIPQTNQQFEFLKNNYLESIMIKKLTQNGSSNIQEEED